MDEQAVLPERGVVGRELLVPADERVEELVVVRQRLEADALGRALDLDPALADVGDAGDVESSMDGGAAISVGAVRRPGVGVEAREVGEAPVLVLRRRQRERPVALEQLGPRHVASSGA